MINYKGTPLFGEDSSVQHTSEFFAIAGTVLFWLLFLIFSFVIKPAPKKPEYKEVQIVLSSTPVVQKTEEAPAPAEQAAAPAAASEPQVVETPVETPAPKVETPKVENQAPAPKPVVKETPKAKTEPKPQPKPAAKKEPAPVKKVETPKPAEPVQYAVDPMEAFAAQTKQQPKKAVDWDAMFADDEPAETSSSKEAKKIVSNEPAFSGSAGTAAATANEKVTSSSSSSNKQSQQASTSTSKALEGIRNSTFKGNAANGVQSESNVKTKNSGSGKVEMEMSNGRSRALIKPAKPVINLTKEASDTIDASITVTITFKVNEKGNVSGVTIKPAAVFADIVKQEITGQLLEWQFEPADYTANATFEYKVVKNN